MDLRGWNERYRSRERATEDILPPPTPLLLEIAAKLAPGLAIDLAAGAGRNSLWLAEHGWSVVAVDGSDEAIGILRERAQDANLPIEAHVADLKSENFAVEPSRYDLVVIAYYLQRSLFAKAKESVKPGGLLLAIVHTTEGSEEPTESRLRKGELRRFFREWEILHEYEGKPADPAHKRAVSEIVAQRPAG